jgi:cytosine permease
VHSINALLRASTGFRINTLALTIVCGAIMSSTAIIGVKALGKVAYLAVPLLLAVISVPTAITLSTRDVHALALAPATAAPFTFGVAVSIIFGGYMVGVTVSPDLTRFLRTPRDVLIGSGVSLGIVLPLLLGLSALLAIAYGSADLIVLLSTTSVGIPALLVIVLATWTSNDKNLYESALALASLLPSVERWKLTAAAGVIGTLIAATGIFAHFIQLLIGLGITIGPIAGVYLSDFMLRRAAYGASRSAVEPAVRWSAIIAWLTGILAGVATLPPGEMGFGWFRLTSISAIDALAAAFVSYAAMNWLALRAAARARACRGV